MNREKELSIKSNQDYLVASQLELMREHAAYYKLKAKHQKDNGLPVSSWWKWEIVSECLNDCVVRIEKRIAYECPANESL